MGRDTRFELGWRQDVRQRLTKWLPLLVRTPEAKETIREKIAELEEEYGQQETFLRQRLEEIRALEEREQASLQREMLKIGTVPALLQTERHLRQLKEFLQPSRCKGRSIRLAPEAIERAKFYPLHELVERQGTPLRRVGSRWVGPCPFHEDRSPSFTVYPDNRFHCFGCGANGDVLEFYQRVQGGDFRGAVAALGGVA